MKSVIYVRISSQGQADGYSIDAQLKLTNDYAEKNNLRVIRIWSPVESAWKDDRKEFTEMLDFVKRRNDVKHIIFDITDRMTRNDMDKIRIYALAKFHDKTIHFARTNKIIDKNFTGDEEFNFDIEVAVAKKMSNDISRKSRMGMIEKAEQGYYPSLAPLGYKNIEIKGNGRSYKILDVDELRAPFIKDAFERYSTGGYSLSAISKTEYKEGLRNSKGGLVDKGAIDKILKNKIYYGDYDWQKVSYTGKHTPLVSRELFDSTQLAFKKQNRPKQTKRQFAFIGLMNCTCKCAITAEIKKGKYIYYHCTGFKGNCGNKYIREEELVEKFAEVLKKIYRGIPMIPLNSIYCVKSMRINLRIPQDVVVGGVKGIPLKIYIDDKKLETFKKTLRDSYSKEIEYTEKKITALTTQKTKLEKRLEQLYLDKLDGNINEEMLTTLQNRTQDELSQINSTIESYRNEDSSVLEKGYFILELCNSAHKLYLDTTPLERGKLLRKVLSNCTLDNATLCANRVGGGVTSAVLPHHRAYGSVHGGSCHFCYFDINACRLIMHPTLPCRFRPLLPVLRPSFEAFA